MESCAWQLDLCVTVLVTQNGTGSCALGWLGGDVTEYVLQCWAGRQSQSVTAMISLTPPCIL
jgi:hypothetical protein